MMGAMPKPLLWKCPEPRSVCPPTAQPPSQLGDAMGDEAHMWWCSSKCGKPFRQTQFERVRADL
jgi:hypothetical protein